MIWNSEFIRRNVSAGRQSVWGHIIIAFVVFGFSIIYAGVCYWPYVQNTTDFLKGQGTRLAYLAVCSAIFVFNVIGILGVLTTTNKYTPEYVDDLITERKISYSRSHSTDNCGDTLTTDS